MATMLYRIGRVSFRRRAWVAAVWLVVLLALGGASVAFKGPTVRNFSIPGTESQRALDALATQFPQASGSTGTIVVVAPPGQTLLAPQAVAAVRALALEAAAQPGVVGVADPYQARTISRDGRYALISVQFAHKTDDITAAERDRFVRTGGAARAAGLRVAHGGEVMGAEPTLGSAEAIGVAVAAVVLVLTFGSLVAAGMTMLNALLGVGVGMAGLYALSGAVQLTSTAPLLALMLGLAVGIDYSLFITARHRQNLRQGLEAEEAAARAVGTAGSAVVFAGATVVIALAGLSIVGIPFLTVMGLAAAGTVVVAVLVAVTLLPALLGFAGRRVLSLRERRPGAPAEGREGFGFRWARLVTHHRVPAILAGVAVLVALAVPATAMRLALPDAGTAPKGSALREAYDLVSAGFGPGFNGRLAVVVTTDSPQATARAAQDVARRLAGTPSLLALLPPQLNQARRTAVLAVVPTTGPSSAATEDLVHEIRRRLAPLKDLPGVDVAVTGATAVGIDVSEKLAGALPVYLVLVVGLSILLLALVFRSILVPVKAALGFLLTVGATFGVTVAVFQRGWGASVLGIDTPGPLVSFLPILLIGILFGLADRKSVV